MVVASSGGVPISLTGMDSDHCDNRAKDGGQIAQRFVSQSRTLIERASCPLLRGTRISMDELQIHKEFRNGGALWSSLSRTQKLGERVKRNVAVHLRTSSQ